MRAHPLRRLGLAVAILVPVLVIAGVIGLVVGPASISLAEVGRALVHGLSHGLDRAGPEVGTTENIVVHLRLPRVVLAAAVGAMVSAAGAVFQSSLRNPLADPLLLGVAGGAAVGAALAIAVGLGTGFVQLGAFAGALATMVFVLTVSARARRADPTTMLLAGVVASTFHTAILMLVLSISPAGGADRVVQWTLGDFGGARWSEAVFAVGATVVLAPVAALTGRTLNVLSLGDETALASGVDVGRVRAAFYTLGAALTAVAVAAAGIVGFVGLVVPHAVRRLFGPDHRVLVPAACLLGAAVAVLADTLARLLVPWGLSVAALFGSHAPAAPVELPVGSVTAFLGAPFFLYLLVRTARRA